MAGVNLMSFSLSLSNTVFTADEHNKADSSKINQATKLGGFITLSLIPSMQSSCQLIYSSLITLGRAGARGKWRAGWLVGAFARPVDGFQAFKLSSFAICGCNFEYKAVLKLENFVGGSV